MGRGVSPGATAPLPGFVEGELAEALHTTDPSLRQTRLVTLARSLAATNLPQAREVAQRLLAGQGRHNGDAFAFVTAAVETATRADPREAVAFAHFLPTDLRIAAYHGLVREWLATEPGPALDWVGRLTEPELRSSTIRAAAQAVEARQAWDAGAVWAQALATASDAPLYSDVIARLWARRDLAGAVRWVDALTEPDARGQAVLALVEEFTAQAPGTASQWVQQFPAGDLRQRALEAAALRWAQTDPGAAAAWLQGLGDVESLARFARSAGPLWLDRDPVAARQWLSQVPLDDPGRQYLLQLGTGSRSPGQP